jgi:hypothetical protein
MSSTVPQRKSSQTRLPELQNLPGLPLPIYIRIVRLLARLHSTGLVFEGVTG